MFAPTPPLVHAVRKSALTLCFFLLAACQKAPEAEYFQGYLEGEYLYIATPLGGELQTLAVRRGAQVESGQPLFALDPHPESEAVEKAKQQWIRAQAALADAEQGKRPSEIAAIQAVQASLQTELELAEQSLERREQALRELKGAFAEEELDQRKSAVASLRSEVARVAAELETARLGARDGQVHALQAEVEASKEALAQAEWALAQKQQSAPAAGTIHDTLYHVGEWVAPGSPVLMLLPPSNLRVRFFVPEPRLAALHAGQEVDVRIDGRPETLPATIRYLSTQAEFSPPVIFSRDSRSKLVYMVEAAVDREVGAELRPGQPVEVTLRP